MANLTEASLDDSGGFFSGVTFNSLLGQVSDYLVQSSAAKHPAPVPIVGNQGGTAPSNAGLTGTDYLPGGALSSLTANKNLILGGLAIVVGGVVLYIVAKKVL